MLACQRNSYLRTLRAIVRGCKPAAAEGQFEVVLSDTVLFPEGGGQPDDRGSIAGHAVVGVRRRDGPTSDVVHTVVAPAPLTEGVEVDVEVDWPRRWDHMQQHSAQHLISAVATRDFAMATIGWSLGRERSYIDFSTAAVAGPTLETLEQTVNTLVRTNSSMTPTLVERSDPLFEKAHGRGLPEGLTGPFRVVEIADLDCNLCCGTHVSGLGHLQAVKLLWAETIKGSARVHFVAGDRVLQLLGSTVERERAIIRVLTVPPEDLVTETQRVKKAERTAAKAAKDYLKEIAELTAARAAAAGERVVYIHRPDGDLEFASSFVSALGDKVLALVTCGEGDQGPFILSGPEEIVSRLGPQIAALLDGKGGGKKGRYQGKANKMSARGAAEKLLRETVAN